MNKLWRKLFPVKKVYVPQYKTPDLYPEDDKKGLLPELVKSQQNSPEMFTWLYIELNQLEQKFHEPPADTTRAGMESYGTTQFALRQEIEAIKRLIKLPGYASAILSKKKIEEEEKKDGKNTNWSE